MLSFLSRTVVGLANRQSVSRTCFAVEQKRVGRRTQTRTETDKALRLWLKGFKNFGLKFFKALFLCWRTEFVHVVKMSNSYGIYRSLT